MIIPYEEVNIEWGKSHHHVDYVLVPVRCDLKPNFVIWMKNNNVRTTYNFNIPINIVDTDCEGLFKSHRLKTIFDVSNFEMYDDGFRSIIRELTDEWISNTIHILANNSDSDSPVKCKDLPTIKSFDIKEMRLYPGLCDSGTICTRPSIIIQYRRNTESNIQNAKIV